jgi:phosphate starvation-inducible PhoH-like protein
MIRMFRFVALTSALFFAKVGSRKVGQGSGGLVRTGMPVGLRPIGPNQQLYAEVLADPGVSMVVCSGPAGSGKTMLACQAMITALESGKVDRLVITRPHVAVDGEDLGFLPGSVLKKMEPWTHPVFDLFGSFLTKPRLQNMLKDGVVEVVPLGFMRGRTFDRTWVLADEMQNSSPTQMLMLLTRLGLSSKMVLTGDLAQSDRPSTMELNGLEDLVDRLVSYSHGDIVHVGLNASDVQRSPVVRHVLELYSESV